MKTPTKRQISAVMAELGRRGNLGRKKRMTRAEMSQRRAAARASAAARHLTTSGDGRRRRRRASPISGHQPGDGLAAA